jgi:hypothetical protein
MYNPQIASTEGKQQYAECIQTLYPVSDNTPMPLGLRVSLLASLVILIVATGIGAWKGAEDDGILGAFTVGMITLIGAALTLGAVGGAIAGFIYLLS